MTNNALPVYHWRRPGTKTNFGDELTSNILRRFCDIDTYWAPPEQARLIGTGSIIEHLPERWNGIILGSGKLHQKLTWLKDATVLSLRGPLTKRNLYVNAVPPGGLIGDIGLLADHLIDAPRRRKLLGIVPHWTDAELTSRTDWDEWEPLVIPVSQEPLEVIKQIATCGKIVTSSLHGCIVADAYGIPVRVEPSPATRSDPYEGGIYKWADYHASLGMTFTPGVTRLAPKQIVEDIQDDLFELLSGLRSELLLK